MKATFYQVLGIPPNAKIRQIRTAIRTMIKTATLLSSLPKDDLPESLQSPEASADLLRLAYYAISVLLDPQKRAQYDQSIAAGAHHHNINRSRYRTLLENTGDAIRRPSSTPNILHPTLGKEHLALLPIGFKWMCTDYWTKRHRIISYLLLLCLFATQGLYTYSQWEKHVNHSQGLFPYEQLIQAIQTASALLLIPGVILFLYMFKYQLGAAHHPPPLQDEVAIIDSTAWNMLELSTNWEKTDRLFLGEDPFHINACWLFNLRMNQLTRHEKKMWAKDLPWRRFWARTIDMAIWGNICLNLPIYTYFITLINIAHHPFFITLMWIWFSITSWIFIEALILSFIGTTPGRYLAGITLHFHTTSTLPKNFFTLKWYHHFIYSLKRCLAVWWHSLGAGCIPISIWLIIRFLTYRPHIAYETTWDAHSDSIVLSHPIKLSTILLGMAWIFMAILAWMTLCFSNT
jgi:hypothetical protein